MTRKHYNIYRSQAEGFDKALEEVLSAIIANTAEPTRITLFASPADNTQFSEQRKQMEEAVSARFAHKPMTAYIAQAPLCSKLAAEVMTIAGEEVESIEYHDDYIVVNGNELISGGIYADQRLGIDQQSEIIFARIKEILNAANIATNDIVRQWNYIEQITHIGERGQHYQLFNDARSAFYDTVQWSNGYPAATGIGAQAGGVTVVFDAIRNSAGHSTPIDNPLQISAHAYSQQVLINNTDAHKTTPKFERARHISGHEQMIHISGTAAIRGEESCQEDITGQTALTMENIDYLTGVDNQRANGVESPEKMEYATMRAYLKYRENLEDVTTWMNDHYPSMQVLYLWADICREELLIEIEGVAKQTN